MIKRLHHIAMAVRDMDEALKLYKELFGLKPSKVETVPDQGVRGALLPIGEAEIELLEPISPDSAVAKFLDSRGEGIHHLCLEVDEIDPSLNELAEKGAQLIDKKGRRGLAGMIGFIHPKTVKGALIELAQPVEH